MAARGAPAGAQGPGFLAVAAPLAVPQRSEHLRAHSQTANMMKLAAVMKRQCNFQERVLQD